jgi:hypothetical protein
MMSFRFRYVLLGGHVHVGVWTSERGPDTTHGCNGRLIFRKEEWAAFKSAVNLGCAVTNAAVAFVPETGLGITESGPYTYTEGTP